jgi:hypothetical protein
MYSQLLKVGQGSVSFVTTSLGPNDPKVGDRCIDGNEAYLFVCNIGADRQISPGLACVLSAVSGYSVTVSSTSSADLLVGVCKHNTIATSGYGWVVTDGFCQITMIATSGSVAAGGVCELGADGKFAPKSNTTANGNYVVKAMEAIVSSASGTAYIRAG